MFNSVRNFFKENRFIFDESAPEGSLADRLKNRLGQAVAPAGAPASAPKSMGDKIKDALTPNITITAPDWMKALGEGLSVFFQAIGNLLGTANTALTSATDFLKWSIDSGKDLVYLLKDAYHGKPKDLPLYNELMINFYKLVDVNGKSWEVNRSSQKMRDVLYYDIRLACIHYRLHQLKVYNQPLIEYIQRLESLTKGASKVGIARRRDLSEQMLREQKHLKGRKKFNPDRVKGLDRDKKSLEGMEGLYPDIVVGQPIPMWQNSVMPGDYSRWNKRFVTGDATVDVKIKNFLRDMIPALETYSKTVSELEDEILTLAYYKGKILADETLDPKDKAAIILNNQIISIKLDMIEQGYDESEVKTSGAKVPYSHLYRNY